MINKINDKMLEMVVRLRELANREEGQTTSEYVAVTAVGVAIALTVIFTTLSGSLTNAVTNIGTAITTFVDDTVTP